MRSLTVMRSRRRHVCMWLVEHCRRMDVFRAGPMSNQICTVQGAHETHQSVVSRTRLRIPIRAHVAITMAAGRIDGKSVKPKCIGGGVIILKLRLCMAVLDGGLFLTVGVGWEAEQLTDPCEVCANGRRKWPSRCLGCART